MSEEAILLKLKREFTDNEAVQILLKRISELEFELGIVKSERDEAIDRMKIGKPKKQWLKDELVEQMQYQIQRQQKRNTEDRKQLEMYRNRYFSIIANHPELIQK